MICAGALPRCGSGAFQLVVDGEAIQDAIFCGYHKSVFANDFAVTSLVVIDLATGEERVWIKEDGQ